MENFIPLEAIQIANPCSADWDKMRGDDRTRFCQSCAKNVYNLSDMTRAQAQQLVNEKEGRLCVQFYQRADGTMLTDQCPIVLRPVRNGLRGAWKLAATGAAALVAIFASAAQSAGTNDGKISCSAQKLTLRGEMLASQTMGSPASPKPVAKSKNKAKPKVKIPPPRLRMIDRPVATTRKLMGEPTMKPQPQRMLGGPQAAPIKGEKR